MKLEEIGEILGYTSNKVRNIESMALRKLRDSKWLIENAKKFAELGYIDKFYLEVFRERGIDVWWLYCKG